MWLSAFGVLVTCTLVLLTAPLAAHAQPATKVYRIGFVSAVTASAVASEIEAFTQRLRDLGYTEGQNLVIEARFAHNQLERVPALVAEVVQLQVDCIVTAAIAATHAAKQATSTIPIVMLSAGDDRVRQGLITSLARPGGNITGITDMSSEVAGKRLELLKEAFPHIARVAYLWDKNRSVNAVDLHEVEAAARRLGVRVHSWAMQGPGELEQALRAAREARVEALMVASPGFPNMHRERIVQLVDTLRLPVMYPRPEFVQLGGLMSYGEYPRDRARRAATLVAKIFQGAQPADLPVERAMKFALVINLTAAKALGLTMPPTFLFQADEVIQ